MSHREKDLAEAIVHYEAIRAKGEAWVDIDSHLKLLHEWLEHEQFTRNEIKRAAEAIDVLEGTAEFNRGHRAAVGS